MNYMNYAYTVPKAASNAGSVSRLKVIAALLFLGACALIALIFESNGQHLPTFGPLLARTPFPSAVALAFAGACFLSLDARTWLAALFCGWSALVFLGIQAMFLGFLNFIH